MWPFCVTPPHGQPCAVFGIFISIQLWYATTAVYILKSVSVSFSVCLCLCHTLFPFLTLSVSVSLSVCVCLCMSFCLTLFLTLSVFVNCIDECMSGLYYICLSA